MNTNLPKDSCHEPDVSLSTTIEYGSGWLGTFEIWQNQKFGTLCEKHCRQNRLFIGDLQLFISNRPLIGNLTVKVYCLPPSRPIADIRDVATKNKAVRLWIYSVSEIEELREHMGEKAKTYILDLRCEKDLLWKNMGSKTRNMVRKGQKTGVVVRQAENEKEFNDWWRTYLSTARTKEFSIQNYDLVLALFRDPSLSKLFVSIIDGQIAGGFFFLLNKQAMYWLGAFDRKFLEWSPSNVCIWESVLWLKEQGFQLLDLGGAVTEGVLGPTRFKRSLGAKLVSAYTYNIPVSGLKSKFLNTLMRFYGNG